MDMKLDIENLSPLKKNLLLILPPVVILAAAFFLLIQPATQEVAVLTAEVEKQLAEIRVAEQKAAKLTELMAENERLKKSLAELQLQLPVEREVSGLLKQVSETGIASGLQVVVWKPREKTVHPSQEVYEIPVDVEVRGQYHRLGQFFSTITGLNRIVNATNLNMKPAGQKITKGSAVLNVTFTAMTYSVIPENEREALKKQGSQKK